MPLQESLKWPRGKAKFDTWAARQLIPIFDRASESNRTLFAVVMDMNTGTMRILSENDAQAQILDRMFTGVVKATMFELLRKAGSISSEVTWEGMDNDFDEKSVQEKFSSTVSGLWGLKTQQLRGVGTDFVNTLFGKSRPKHWVDSETPGASPENWPATLPYLAPGNMSKKVAIKAIAQFIGIMKDHDKPKLMQAINARFPHDRTSKLAVLKVIDILLDLPQELIESAGMLPPQ